MTFHLARPLRRRLAFSLALCLSTLGCGGYFPLRWPRRDLWSPGERATHPIELPSRELADYPGRVRKEGVSVVAALIGPSRATDVFGVDLLRNGVQPLLVIIRNDSPHPYLFRKANVDPKYLSAARVARLAEVHPTVAVARYLKWLFFIIPGFVFDTVVEPATTLEFPGMREAAQRPPRAHDPRITADFVNNEIPDAEIRPQSSLAGVMFVRPLKLGGVLPVTLVNIDTRQPVIVEIPTPPPVYVEQHEYSHPYETVWDAVVKTAAHIPSWRLTSTDQPRGTIAVHHGLTFLAWTSSSTMTISLQKLTDQKTQVALQSTLPQADSRGYGKHSRTVDRFFGELSSLFPQPQEELPLEHAPSPSPSTSLQTPPSY